MEARRPGLLVAVVALVGAAVARAHDDEVRFGHLAGGGPRNADCLGSLEVAGVDGPRRGRVAVCEDGDSRCDRDRLVNGRCELWVRVCLNAIDDACGPRAVAAASVDGEEGRDLTILRRTLEHVTMPAAERDTCAPVTTLTVPLGKRHNGSAKKGRRLYVLTASGEGDADRDAFKLVCKPPPKVRRRDTITFAGLQRRIFERSCAFSGCHGVENPQANLMLTGDHVYESLVDRLATTSAAQFAGKKLVVPGAPETSFLMDKLLGKLGPTEGAPMPLGRTPLTDAQIGAIRKWILAGAPRERAIAGGLGEEDRQPRIPAPAAPPGGYQAHMTPFMMGDRPETEGCQVVRLDNEDELFAGRWELFMHEGSHHFILRAHRCPDPDGDGVTVCDDPGFLDRLPTGFAPCEQFGFNWAFVVGSQTPHYLVDYQTEATGVAFKLRRRQPLLLNSHYTNPFSDTMAEVWVNVSPVDAARVRHPARILFEVIANIFIKVPPGTTSTAAAHHACAFTDDALCTMSGEPPPAAERFALLGITSHMHKRSLKFVTDLHDLAGNRIERPDDMTDPADRSKHTCVSTDYDDPVSLAFWPPIIVERGQRLRYTCSHDNGVTTPVRLGCEETAGVVPGRSILDQFIGGGDLYDGAARWCRSDDDCTGFGTGRCVPANLVFGELADDDMCILPGLYYPCPGDAASCVE